MSKSPQIAKTLDAMAIGIFGRTVAHAHAMKICVDCGQPAAPDGWSKADYAEWRISGLCPKCFNSIFDESIWED